MPSRLHESLLELVRNCGEVVCPLLRGRVALPPGELVAEALSADFSQVSPTEYRADHVLALRVRGGEPRGKPDLVVVIEVQRSIDERKQYTWPVYVTTAASKHECAAVLLVIAPDPHVARWARGPFEPSPGFKLHPIVISYADVPEHWDEETARRWPELAVLAAMAHPRVEIARQALGVIHTLPSDRSGLYYDMILQALSEALGDAREARMIIKGYEYKSEFARHYLSLGEAEGLRKGQEEGLRRGQEEHLAAFHRMALDLARCKLGELPSDVTAAAIRSLRDDSVLSTLILALGRARQPEEARASIERAIAGGGAGSPERGA